MCERHKLRYYRNTKIFSRARQELHGAIIHICTRKGKKIKKSKFKKQKMRIMVLEKKNETEIHCDLNTNANYFLIWNFDKIQQWYMYEGNNMGM